jgi:branched-chain amino acid transport system substrate-binding protein
MKHQLKLAGLAVLLGVVVTPATAQERLKIGVIVTLSGPAAALGQQVRDGFALAVRDLGGKMGGREVEVVNVDDELKPDAAVTKVKGLLERDKVDFVVGPIFSNILQAIHKPVTDSKTFLISPNAGPSSYAGKNCSPFFYVTSYQNDQVHEVLGKVAQDRGYKRVYVLVPNYQAGKDSAAGFKLDARHAGFPGRALQDRVAEARRAVHVHAGRDGRRTGETVQPGRACRQDSGALGVHGR